jgi:hypothetical protein
MVKTELNVVLPLESSVYAVKLAEDTTSKDPPRKRGRKLSLISTKERRLEIQYSIQEKVGGS